MEPQTEAKLRIPDRAPDRMSWRTIIWCENVRMQPICAVRFVREIMRANVGTAANIAHIHTRLDRQPFRQQFLLMVEQFSTTL